MSMDKIVNEYSHVIARIETGKELSKIRNGLHMSLAEASKKLGISISYLSEIERGVKTPSDHLIREMAQVYELDEDDLFSKFGKIPFLVRQELEHSPLLQKTILDISRNKKLTEEQKERIYDKIHETYKTVIKDLEEL